MGLNFPDAPADGALFGQWKWDAATGAWKPAVGSGGGDVTGPAGAVADDIAVFNGATGKAVKDGGRKISDLALKTRTSLSGVDLNTVVAEGGYIVDDTSTNLPSAGLYYYLDVAEYVDPQFVRQIATTLNSTAEHYIRKKQGTWGAWRRVAFIDAQTLTSAEQDQVRKNVYAAPLDALAQYGLQQNGAIEVTQEYGFGTGFTVAGRYVCDGWVLHRSGTMAVTAAAINSQPNYIGSGITNYLLVTVGTAQAVIGAGDYAFIWHPIEGYRIARLAWGTANARPITIGFWSSHNRAGIYSVAFRNVDGSRSYVATYTQAVANTPQWNVITVPGCTTGTWNITNGTGLTLTFAQAMGTSYTAPSANVWHSTNYMAASGQVNAVAATSDYLVLSGLIILPGNDVPIASRSALIVRPYDQEILLAQRYFQRVEWNLYIGSAVAGNYSTQNIRLLPMRAAGTASAAVVGGNTNFSAPSPGVNAQYGFNGQVMMIYAYALAAGYSQAYGYVDVQARL
jgi:hypothetical protein